jgi:hypothetical protein
MPGSAQGHLQEEPSMNRSAGGSWHLSQSHMLPCLYLDAAVFESTVNEDVLLSLAEPLFLSWKRLSTAPG